MQSTPIHVCTSLYHWNPNLAVLPTYSCTGSNYNSWVTISISNQILLRLQEALEIEFKIAISIKQYIFSFWNLKFNFREINITIKKYGDIHIFLIFQEAVLSFIYSSHVKIQFSNKRQSDFFIFLKESNKEWHKISVEISGFSFLSRAITKC